MNKKNYVTFENAWLAKFKGCQVTSDFIYNECGVFINKKDVGVFNDLCCEAAKYTDILNWLKNKCGKNVIITEEAKDNFTIKIEDLKTSKTKNVELYKYVDDKKTPVVYKNYEFALNTGITEALMSLPFIQK